MGPKAQRLAKDQKMHRDNWHLRMEPHWHMKRIARTLISPHAIDINSGHSQAYYIAYCRDNLHRASEEATDRLEGSA
jgi:hypothetical protein